MRRAMRMGENSGTAGDREGAGEDKLRGERDDHPSALFGPGAFFGAATPAEITVGGL